MAPIKRQRPDSTETTVSSCPAPPNTAPAMPAENKKTITGEGGSDAIATPHLGIPSKPLKKPRSWYGPWPRVPKATTSTQLTKETIFGGTPKPNEPADFSRYDIRRGSDAASVRSGVASLSRFALTTNGRAKEEGYGGVGGEGVAAGATGATAPERPAGAKEDRADTDMADAKPKPDPGGDDSKTASAEVDEAGDGEDRDDDTKSVTDSVLTPPVPGTPVRPSTPVGWLGWLWQPTAAPLPSGEGTTESEEPKKDMDSAEETPTGPPLPLTSPAPESSETSVGAASSSWFGFWGAGPTVPPPVKEEPEATGAAAAAATTSTTTSMASSSELAPETRQSPEEENVVVQEMPPLPTTKAPEEAAPSAGSTWAFWSRDTGPRESGRSTPRPEPGEIAVMGDKSETQPEPASRSPVDPDTDAKSNKLRQDDDGRDVKKADSSPKYVKGKAAAAMAGKKGKHSRVEPSEAADAQLEPPPQPRSASLPSTPAKTTEQPRPGEILAKPVAPPNLLLPSLGSTYRMKENSGIVRQLGRLLVRASPVSIPFVPPAPSPTSPHQSVLRTPTPPRIRRAVAVGVHGIFPGALLRSVMGQPTGTSLRFASQCANAIRRWADGHGCSDCEIEKVALEGEGRIGDRVENLWKLLLNWVDHLRGADLVVVACHSQGVPVAVMLLARLIQEGILAGGRVGVCAMAGVSLGPFPPKYGGMLMGSAAELLELSNPRSDVSRRYEEALSVVLRYGGRITYVGSIDDQLVPMESSINSPLHHPYIYRAVFIDGRIHAPDFIVHLIGFALKLRNLGVSDHGLIRELSAPLAASLSLFGGGHSRLYYDDQVYDLGLAHALETAPLPGPVDPEFRHPAVGAVGVANNNPYHLPWLMRGLLAEELVQTELSAEADELLRRFDEWNPTTPKLKDVKYRLEAIRSRL